MPAKFVRLNQNIPLIFLTAKSMKEDKIQGFKIGCDDYITKPFSIEELLLRIQAVLKRSLNTTNTDINDEYKIGKYIFDTKQQVLSLDSEVTKLTSKENDLLILLCQNINKTLTRETALKNIWGDDNYFNSRSMDVFISRLRKYLKNDPTVSIISIHGKGFRLVVS